MFEVDGLNDLLDYMKSLEEVPQRVVTKTAKAGGQILLNEARIDAPVKSGDLENGLMLVRNSKSGKGKSFYDVQMNPAMNNTFRSDIKVQGKYGGRFPTGYYPASMEYGFLTKHGKVEGYHYMKKAATTKESDVYKTMLLELSEAIDKLK